MRDLCARSKTFVHAEQWRTNLALIFIKTNTNTFMIQMEETNVFLLQLLESLPKFINF